MKKIKELLMSIIPFIACYGLYEIAPEILKSIIYATVLIGLGVLLILVKRLLSDLHMHYMEITVLRTLLDSFHGTKVTKITATEWCKSDKKESRVTIVDMNTGEYIVKIAKSQEFPLTSVDKGQFEHMEDEDKYFSGHELQFINNGSYKTTSVGRW